MYPAWRVRHRGMESDNESPRFLTTVGGTAVATGAITDAWRAAGGVERRPTPKWLPRLDGCGAATPFAPGEVTLLPGPCADALARNQRYLHSLPTDRLLHTFRITAGLPSSAQPVGGWEKPDCELRGHFSGHYLSACALMHAHAGDHDLERSGREMAAALAACQAKIGNGYLSAYPEELYDRLKDGRKVWAPFYTYHKILAGHSISTRSPATPTRSPSRKAWRAGYGTG